MMNLSCPICSKRMQIEKIDDLPSFPFCSDRCKLIDLGRWIDGAYAIASSASGQTTRAGSSGEEGDEEKPSGDWVRLPDGKDTEA
jgi:uncharacterized protein